MSIHLDQPALKTIEYLIQQLYDGISFAQGTLHIGGVDQSIRAYAQTILDSDKADYYAHSLGIALLRQKLVEKLSAQFHTTIPFEQLIITHGSINGIAALCLLLLDQGDEVLVPEPSYPPFVNAVSLAKGIIKFVPAYKQITTVDGSLSWTFDLSLLKASRTPQTKMLIIAHPSNPCGVCLTQEELIELAIWCNTNGIYCIFDEAYENYFFDIPTTSSTALVVKSEFIIRTGSFSKTYGMSGWRIGYIVAPKKIIDRLAAIQDGLIVCPSVIGQYAALYALDHPEIAVDYTNYVLQNRNRAYDALMPLIKQEIINYAKPPAGFFLFIKTSQKDTTHLSQMLFKKAKVALVPGKDFGPSGNAFLRLCYARKREVLKEGLTRIINFFNINQV